MPNWNVNYIRLYHDDSNMIDRVVAAYMRDELFREFMPPPEFHQIARTEVIFDWRRENWGTKWDVGQTAGLGANVLERRNDHEVFLVLLTAWNAPRPIFDWWVQLGFDVSACSDDQESWGSSVVYINGLSAEVFSKTDYEGSLFDEIFDDDVLEDELTLQ